MHKLTAGSGYDYLTRQVAAMDSTEKGYTGLASYYTERGETPGVWIGTGCDAIRPGFAGSIVTAEQMQALFGAGTNPIGPELQRALGDASSVALGAAIRLGSPFPLTGEVTAFRVEVARQIDALNRSRGLPGAAGISVDDRAAIRSRVARGMFAAEFGRAPLDARELSGFVARASRPVATTVAGFDLTFSPPKSVSTLWAVASPGVAARIEAAHREAVATALRYVESSLLFTREGTGGARQVNVTGLIGAAFTHRDTRAGDPDLHTHVAVANKVKATGSGKWLAIDGRVLFKGIVAASETYNTALVKLLERQGLRFEDRHVSRDRGRPVREISGVPHELNERWSTRRAEIEAYREHLIAAFQRDHGRPPTVVESVKLAQQATLATRDVKHEPRTIAEQRAVWHRQAIQVLGGEDGLRHMLARALTQPEQPGQVADAAWFEQATSRILAAAEARGATWQDVHLRAEAQRQIRYAQMRIDQISAAVELLVSMAKDRCISLARPDHGIHEPPALRRADGASVYTVAGFELYTTQAVLAAERRLVDLAGTKGARVVPADIVAEAISNSGAAGQELTEGQGYLVTQMATSGARLQLAIAPAGAGKTTAMQVLGQAWTAAGGTVIGLAPSAAAAAQLRAQTRSVTDTMAKLVHGIDHHDLPAWASGIGPGTLVIVDEAGMADTISLDKVTTWLAGRGATIRLIGDDQQLAAIGAGGVLRDIRAVHGAINLTELMRFADPAEAAASLALRDGDPAALGFYLDNNRVHVGDLATVTDHAYTAWRTDQDRGLDAVLLAPTVALVADLNARARTDRLARTDDDPGWEAALADGNKASAGDVVITRTNDRRLRWSRTDWVKNGDRWTVCQVSPSGDLRVQHRPTGQVMTLPHQYVAASVELGYACTIHAAQGISSDTTHTVATPDLTRQQLYTMATRGRFENHIWLQTVTDGDDTTLIRPEAITPPSPTDLLEQILSRDASPESATSVLLAQTDPRLQLGDAVRAYTDGITAAAEHHLGSVAVTSIEDHAQHVLPGIIDEAAWPTLRTHLILLAAHGHDTNLQLGRALSDRDLVGARDRAAVLAWRLDPATLPGTHPGPLPWLSSAPDPLLQDPEYGPWLGRRARLVADLATAVRDQAVSQPTTPVWVTVGARMPETAAVVDIEVWRAAMSIDPADRRPTGPMQISRLAFEHQTRLLARVRDGQAPALAEWRDTLHDINPTLDRDPYAGHLAEHLAALSRANVDTRGVLLAAVATGPLPDDHSASALWWRITRILTRDALTAAHQRPTPGQWATHLADLVGADTAVEVQQSPFWPTLAGLVDTALERGHTLHSLLGPAPATPDMDHCLALICQIATLTSGPPDTLENPHEDLPPADRDLAQPLRRHLPPSEPVPDASTVDADLALAALIHQNLGRPEATDADIRRMFARADAWRDCPIPRDRFLHINQLTQDYYASQLPGSWAQTYLDERFHTDLTGHPQIQPGSAPAGWTSLVRHLRAHGVSDDEMVIAGVAIRTRRTKSLIDQFRDRVVFPITDPTGAILGFVGRRHPDASDDVPKYLNTPETALFHKGDQFYGTWQAHTIPVIVEGPMDAIAVTLSSRGRYSGLAPLGTSLTDQQAELLYGQGEIIIATDADAAGHKASARDYWQLTAWGTDPSRAPIPSGSDPASILTNEGAATLASILAHATPMATQMIHELTCEGSTAAAISAAAAALAASPIATWPDGIALISRALDAPPETVRTALADEARKWNADPRKAAEQGIAREAETRRHSRPADPRTAQPTVEGPQERVNRSRPLGHFKDVSTRRP
ncbi:MAG: MobF family relaxase [Propionibacteriaceae bacterium]